MLSKKLKLKLERKRFYPYAGLEPTNASKFELFAILCIALFKFQYISWNLEFCYKVSICTLIQK